MADQPKGNSWHDVSAGRLGKVFLIIFLCIAIPISAASGLMMVLFLVLMALLDGTTELPVLLFYVVLTILALFGTYYYFRRQPRRDRFMSLFVALAASVLIALVTNGLTYTVYQKYRIARAMPKMEKLLEGRYDEDFVIINGDYCQSTKIGTISFVCADAYAKSNPDHVFIVTERGGGFSENYKTP